MGGKTKQSQRTKNNARPSSSGRSALQLTNVNLESGVMNIHGTELPALFPTLAAPNIDPLVSPELQMCIKKLNKKDPITKAKALQELSELASNSKVDDVVAALPSWTHFYKVLAMDPDRKVREATQSCHGVIMSVCGRRVAPHLRQLLPHWLQAQYDEHAPAQAHAQHSLAKTFPDSKLPEVISFCKNEVMAHITENLTGGDESASNKKPAVPRAPAAGLLALRALGAGLPRAQDAWLRAAAAALLLRPAAWAPPHHAEPRVRAAWYAAMGQLIQRFPEEFAEQHGQKTLRILVGVKESNPQAAAQLWDCMLIFMHDVREWHKYLDKKELLIKRILDLLENGGWGDAKHLSNMLLPLLANMPPAMLNKEFYITFFNAMFTGLEKKTILGSKSERQSWLTTLDECLRYISIQQHDYVLEIVTSVHRTWLENILSDKHDGQTRTNLIKHSASSMAASVKYWLKQAQENNSEKYDQLIRNFWQNVGSTITTQIEKLSNNPTDIGKLVDGHILLLQTLKISFMQEAKRQQSIKFDDDAPNVVEKSQTEVPPCDASIADRYNHNLTELVGTISGYYFEFASKRQISNPVLAPIVTLLVDFDSGKLFPAIARQFDCDSTYQLYDKVLRSWLAGDTMRCEAVIDITFLSMEHMSEPEQDAAFDSFKQFPPAVVDAGVLRALRAAERAGERAGERAAGRAGERAAGRAAARRWLRGPQADAALAGACTRLLRHGDRAARDLLLLCLDRVGGREPAVSERAEAQALERLSAAACAEEAPHRELVGALGARLAGAGRPALLLGLFRLSALVPRPDGSLPPAAWAAVRAAWSAGAAALPPAERRALLAAAAAALRRRLRLPGRAALPEPAEAEPLLALCPHLVPPEEAAAFSRQLLRAAPVAPRLVEYYILRHEVVRGDLGCPFEDGPLAREVVADQPAGAADELTLDNFRAYVDRCTLRAIYLRTMFLHQADGGEAAWCDRLLLDDYFVQEYCDVYRDFVVVVSVCGAYAFWPHYRLVEQTKARLENLVQDIFNECSLESKTRVLNALTRLAASEGYFWAYAREYFHTNMKLAMCKSSQENPESSQENPESSQENPDRSQEKPDDDQEKPENEHEKSDSSSQEKSDSSQEKTDRCQEKAFGNQGNTDNSQEKLETSQDETKRDFPVEDDNEFEEFESINFDNLQDIITGRGFFHMLQARARGGRGRVRVRAAYAAMVRALRAGARAGGRLRPARDCGADVIVNLYYEDHDVVLYERDASAAPWAAVARTAAVGHYLAALVAERGWLLPAHHWDFATISACHLLSSAAKSAHDWGRTKVAMLICAALALYEEVERFIREVPKASESRRPAAHVAHLPDEWRDIFAPDLQGSLFRLFQLVLESSGATPMTSTRIAVLDRLVRCARAAASLLPPRGALAPGAPAPGALARAAAAALQAAPHHAYLLLAHAVLCALRPALLREDEDKLAAWAGGAGEGEEGEGEGEERAAPQLALHYLQPAYSRLQALVGAALAHLPVCAAACSLAEGSDAQRLALGWLLLADGMAALARAARGDLPHHYARLYRQHGYTEPLLEATLRLLPEEVFARAQRQEPPLAALVPLFHALPPLGAYEYCSARTVSEAACRGLALCVCGPGAGGARGWRGAAPHRRARLLDRLVRDYISPTVAKDEIMAVQNNASELENADVTVQWSSWEVRCVLTLEERPIELSVQLSRSHPLGLPRVAAPEQPAPGAAHWLLMYMAHQGGSLRRALRLWAGSVSQTVARAGHCYICYCRMHYRTGRLPGVLCRQCQNKYHVACLRKWFSTANKSNCPLCRTPF